MSPAHSLVAINFKAEIVALQGWDRTPVWALVVCPARRKPGAGQPEQYAPDHRFGQIAAGSGAAAGGRLLSAPDPALTTHTLDSTVEYRVRNGGMRSSQVAARAGINGQTLRYYERRTC